MAAGTLTLQLPNKTKDVHWIVDGPQGSVAVLLAHGAGGDAASGNLPALTGALAAAGFPVLRFTCRGGNLEHRVAVTKALLKAASGLLGLVHVRLWVMAGHSMGARVACAVAASPPPGVQVAAVLLSSYPLHPPGKPQQLRDALLHGLPVPAALLVRGSKDPFSQQALWDAAVQGIPAACKVQQHTVAGGDHSLCIGGAGGAAASEAALQGVTAAAVQFLREVAAAGGQRVAPAPAAPAQRTAGKQPISKKAGKRKPPSEPAPQSGRTRRW